MFILIISLIYTFFKAYTFESILTFIHSLSTHKYYLKKYLYKRWKSLLIHFPTRKDVYPHFPRACYSRGWIIWNQENGNMREIEPNQPFLYYCYNKHAFCMPACSLVSLSKYRLVNNSVKLFTPRLNVCSS